MVDPFEQTLHCTTGGMTPCGQHVALGRGTLACLQPS